jgi:transposase-like protein
LTESGTTVKLVLRKEEKIPRGNWSAEEKQKIVLAGLRNETSVAEICRRHSVNDVNVLQMEEGVLRWWIECLKGQWQNKQPRGRSVGLTLNSK